MNVAEGASPAAIKQLQAQGYRLQESFRGPPGTGKTTRARALAVKLTGEGRDAIVMQRADGTEGWDEVWAR